MVKNANYVRTYTVWCVDICYTDKKENKIFLIYDEIQKGSDAMSFMTNRLASPYMTKYLRISSYI